MQKIKINEDLAVPEFVFEYLKLVHNIKVTEVMQTQTNGIRKLSAFTINNAITETTTKNILTAAATLYLGHEYFKISELRSFLNNINHKRLARRCVSSIKNIKIH